MKEISRDIQTLKIEFFQLKFLYQAFSLVDSYLKLQRQSHKNVIIKNITQLKADESEQTLRTHFENAH